MTTGDRARWDARHAVVTDDVAMPPDALRGREHLLLRDPAGTRALDVACGRGTVAVWLARRGAAVDAIDVSGIALAAGSALAERAGIGPQVRWWHHDLDSGLPPGCAGPYDVVVCQRFRDPALYPALAGRLAVGGLLVITVLSEVDAGPGAFRAPAGELRAAFRDLEVLDHREGDGAETLLARSPIC